MRKPAWAHIIRPGYQGGTKDASRISCGRSRNNGGRGVPFADPSRLEYIMQFIAPFGKVRNYVVLCGLIEEHLIIKFGPLRPTLNTGTTSNVYIV